MDGDALPTTVFVISSKFTEVEVRQAVLACHARIKDGLRDGSQIVGSIDYKYDQKGGNHTIVVSGEDPATLMSIVLKTAGIKPTTAQSVA